MISDMLIRLMNVAVKVYKYSKQKKVVDVQSKNEQR
jgi:hypothetical protein